MTRVALCGLELSDFSEALSSGGTVSIGGTPRTGNSGLRCNPTTSAVGWAEFGGFAASGAPARYSAATARHRVYFSYNGKPSTATEEIAIILDDTGSGKMYLRINNSGQLRAFASNGTTALAAAGSTSLVANTVYMIDILCGTGASASWEVRIDGVSEISGTSSSIGSNNCGSIILGKRINRNSNSVEYFFDDLAVDDAGYCGASSIVNMKPDSNGNYTAWTGDFNDCDETLPHDGDTSFAVAGLVINDAETFGLQSSESAGIPPGSTIKAVVAWAILRGVSGTATAAVRSRWSGTDSDSSNNSPTTTYGLFGKLLVLDPSDSGAITTTDLDGVEVGAVQKTVAFATRMTACGMMVEFVPQIPGTGALTAPSPQIASSGKEVFQATGTLTAPSPSTSGTGREVLQATGTLTAPSPSVAATGLEVLQATGALTAPSPSLAATGLEVLQATGTLTAPSPQLAGSGTQISSFIGTGTLTAPSPAVEGIGLEVLRAVGVITAPMASIAALGAASGPFVGTSTLTAPSPSIAGIGVVALGLISVCGWEVGDESEMFAVGGTGHSVTTSNARSGTYCFRINVVTGSLTAWGELAGYGTGGSKVRYNAATGYHSGYFRRDNTFASGNGEEFLEILDTSGARKMVLRLVNTSGSYNIKAYESNGTTLMATGATSLSASTYYRVSVKCGTGASAPWEVLLNGVSEISGTSSNIGGNNCGSMRCGKVTNRLSNTVDYYYDDWAISNTSYPDGRVLNAKPNANGTYTSWTGVYTDTDDIPPNTSDFAASTLVVGDAETNNVENSSTIGLSSADLIHAVLPWVQCISITGTGSYKLRYRIGGTDVDLVANNQGTASYQFRTTVVPLDASGAAITPSTFDGIEVGSVQNGTSFTIRMTACGAMVYYSPRVTGSGALTAPSPSTSGTGQEVFQATGTLTAPSPSTSGTGQEILRATGALTAPSPSIAGAGNHAEDVAGTGSLTAPSPNVSGSGLEVLQATGALSAPSPQIAATGFMLSGIAGTGSLTAPSPSVSGSGLEVLLATGALTAPSPSIAATGSVASSLSGTGSLTAPSPQVAGTGLEVLVAAGALTAPSPQLAGIGSSTSSTITGTGSLTAPSPSIGGVGFLPSADIVVPVALPTILPNLFPHNWDVEVELETSYETDITESVTVAQERSQLKARPTREMEARFLSIDQSEAQRLTMTLARSAHQRSPLPLYCDQSEVTQTSSGLTIFCDTTNRRLSVGQRIVIHSWDKNHRPINEEYALISAVSPSSLTVASVLTGTFDLGDVVFPCIDVEIGLQRPFEEHTDYVPEVTFSASEVDGLSALIPITNSIPSNLQTHLGIPILPVDINWADEQTGSFSRAGERFGSGRAEMVLTRGTRPQATYELHYTTNSRAEAFNLIGLFDYCRGRRRPFWAVRADTLYDPISITTAQVVIDATGNIEDLQDFISHVAIVRKDGTILIRAVNLVTDLTGSWQIDFDFAIPSTLLSDIVRVTPALLCISTRDVLHEKWFVADGVCEISWEVQELLEEISVTIADVYPLPAVPDPFDLDAIPDLFCDFDSETNLWTGATTGARTTPADLGPPRSWYDDNTDPIGDVITRIDDRRDGSSPSAVWLEGHIFTSGVDYIPPARMDLSLDDLGSVDECPNNLLPTIAGSTPGSDSVSKFLLKPANTQFFDNTEGLTIILVVKPTSEAYASFPYSPTTPTAPLDYGDDLGLFFRRRGVLVWNVCGVQVFETLNVVNTALWFDFGLQLKSDTIGLGANDKFYIAILTWKPGQYCRVYMNGLLMGEATTVATALPTGTSGDESDVAQTTRVFDMPSEEHLERSTHNSCLDRFAIFKRALTNAELNFAQAILGKKYNIRFDEI